MREPPTVAAPGGIALIILAMFFISVNDMLIKLLSVSYPLHQMVFIRSAIGIVFSLTILQFEGGLASLRPRRVGLHALRALCLVVANMAFFAGLAVIPLADATALFFVAPLFITLLSIFFLGEKVGIRRLAAVVVGFIGVLVMLRPGSDAAGPTTLRLVLLLPVVGAFAYAVMQILTRRLADTATASAMAVYVQTTFIMVSTLFWLIAGDGRFVEGLTNPSMVFLLRAWTWPTADDWMLLAILGATSAVIGYSLAQAYRTANAATIAPFEYTAMPMSIFWGWLMFGHLPDAWVAIGILLIAIAGLYVFVRERQIARWRNGPNMPK